MVKTPNPSKRSAKTKSKYLVPLFIIFILSAVWTGLYFYYLDQSRCPEGYVRIPVPDKVLRMCVAKYEMKKDENGNAVSRPEGLPWIKITRNEAIQACRANGKRYDLITNQAWNYVAHAIAEVPDNWNTGVNFDGILNSGYNSKDSDSPLEASRDDKNDNCYKTGEKCDSNTWNISRRTHMLKNRKMIWDFSGNVAEFVSGEVDKNANIESTYIKFLLKRKYQFENFGPKKLCIPEPSTIKLNYYCGYGSFNAGMELGTARMIKIDNPEIIRGGNWKAPERNLIGIYTTTLIKPDTLARVVGFRCTYSPMPIIRSFQDLPNLLF